MISGAGARAFGGRPFRSWGGVLRQVRWDSAASCARLLIQFLFQSEDIVLFGVDLDHADQNVRLDLDGLACVLRSWRLEKLLVPSLQVFKDL